MKRMIKNGIYAFACIVIIWLLAAGCGSGQFFLSDPIDAGSEIDSGTAFEILNANIDSTSDGEITFEFDCEAIEDAVRIEGSARNVATNETIATEWTYNDSLVEGIQQCRGTLTPLTRWPNCADIEGRVDVELTQASATGALATQETELVSAVAQLQTICTGMRDERSYGEALNYLRVSDSAYQSSLTNVAGDNQTTIERIDSRGANVFTEELTRIVEDSYIDSTNATYDRLNYNVTNEGNASLTAIGQQGDIARSVKLDAKDLTETNVATYEVVGSTTQYTDVAIDSAGNEYLVGNSYSLRPAAGPAATGFVQIRDASGALIDTFTYPDRADMQYIERIEIHDGDYYMMLTFDGMPTAKTATVAYSTAAEMADFRSGAAGNLVYTMVELAAVGTGTFRDMVATDNGLAMVGEYIRTDLGGGLHRQPLLATMDAGAFVSYRTLDGTFDNAYLTAVDRDVNAIAGEKLVAVANLDGDDAILKVGMNELAFVDEIDMCLSIESMTLNAVSVDEDSIIYASGTDFDPVTGETFSATAITDRDGYIFGKTTVDFKNDYNLSVDNLAP